MAGGDGDGGGEGGEGGGRKTERGVADDGVLACATVRVRSSTVVVTEVLPSSIVIMSSSKSSQYYTVVQVHMYKYRFVYPL